MTTTTRIASPPKSCSVVEDKTLRVDPPELHDEHDDRTMDTPIVLCRSFAHRRRSFPDRIFESVDLVISLACLMIAIGVVAFLVIVAWIGWIS